MRVVSLEVVMCSSFAGVGVVVIERQGAVVTISRAAGVCNGVMMLCCVDANVMLWLW